MESTLGVWAPTYEENASKESDRNFNMMNAVWKVLRKRKCSCCRSLTENYNTEVATCYIRNVRHGQEKISIEKPYI